MSDVHLLIILFHFQSSPYSRTHVRIYTNTSELTHSFALNSSVRVIIFMCSVVPENNKSGPYSAFPIPIYHAYMLKMLNTHTCKTFTTYIYTRARTPTLKKILYIAYSTCTLQHYNVRKKIIQDLAQKILFPLISPHIFISNFQILQPKLIVFENWSKSSLDI